MLPTQVAEFAMNIFYDQVGSRAFVEDYYLMFGVVASRRIFNSSTNTKETSFEKRLSCLLIYF